METVQDKYQIFQEVTFLGSSAEENYCNYKIIFNKTNWFHIIFHHYYYHIWVEKVGNARAHDK